jgi:hypothetical protein
MFKPIQLFVAILCALVSQAQKTDTLILHYKTDQYTISKQDKEKLDSFMQRSWDKILIKGYTDETDEEEYNFDLSKKRSGEVYRYFRVKNIPDSIVSAAYFGESMAIADNNSDEGRALNRRTEIIGFQFPKRQTTSRVDIKPRIASARPLVDPMKPVTRVLDNGFIITYKPGGIPAYLADYFESGSGMNFQLITNTKQMRENNFYNNTTRGELLSSVLIICGDQRYPCKLDTPVFVRIPIPLKTNCPIEMVKFFVAVEENGKRIWKEQTKQLSTEIIGGKKYVGVWMDNFCGCINFDFKIDPDCYDIDSTQVEFVNATIRNLSVELKGMNSIYRPRKISDSTHRIVFLKDRCNEALISFTLYKGQGRSKSFWNRPLAAFPYDKTTGKYLLSADTIKFYVPRFDMHNVVLKVNGDKYWTFSDNDRYQFIYLHRNMETICVDFTVWDAKGNMTRYKDQPLESIPYNESGGYYIIDKNFLQALRNPVVVARQ